MKSVLLFLLTVLITLPLSATELKTTLSKDSVAIGEVFKLTVTVPEKNGKKPLLEEYEEWQETIRVREVKEEGNNFIFSLSTYSAPLCSIPSFLFRYDEDTTKISTPPLTVPVFSLLPDSGATSKEFRSPLKAGKFPMELVAIGITLITILITVLALILKKKQPLVEEKIIPETPPYEEAIEGLLMLQREQLLDKGEFKQYAFSLSEILKRYISRRFECPVQESTATEFREWIDKSDLSKEHKKLLEKFIMETEPVKFANIIPAIATFETLLKEVRLFCEETKPQVAVPETEELKERKS